MWIVTLFVVTASSQQQASDDVSEAGWKKLSLGERKMYTEQWVADLANDDAIPLLFEDYEIVPEIGYLEIGSVIGSGPYSLVFGIKKRSDLVIKYATNCDELENNMHPLVRDFRFGTIAARAGVAVKPIFLSPPVFLPAMVSPKTTFPMKTAKYEYCVKRRATLRYMIMPKVGSCVDDVPRIPYLFDNLLFALDFGWRIVDLLEKLHTAEVVHGDVHSGNICSMNEGQSYVLIDFGLASFATSESSIRIREPLALQHPNFSPWQLMGFPNGRRDDVFNALFQVAQVLNPLLPDYVANLPTDVPSDLLEFKLNANFFEYPEDLIGQALCPEVAFKIKDDIQRAMNVLRAAIPQGPINYEYITKAFKDPIMPLLNTIG